MTSSPKPTKAKPTHKKQVRILNINLQSLRKKGKLLETIIESTDPDIIMGQKRGLTQLLNQAKYSLTTIYMIGDDVMIGESELNDVALKDGELMLDPDFDGIDASLMLSTNKGLVDIFTDECLLPPQTHLS
jgi:hypothetical protein